MSVLHHLALQCEALVILLQETHCTSVERLDLPSYHLAGFSLSRKHGLATFVHERLKWILIDQSPLTSEIEWVCVDVDNYKIVNVYKPPPTRMQASDLPAFPHPCLYAGDFNCHHVDWGHNINNPDGECLAGWASANNFTLLAGTGWGASAKTLRTAALSLVYSTAEYCAPVWCRSVHIRLIDSVINDALRIVTGCLRPTPSVYLPVLSGIQPAELRRQGATLSLANRSSLDPDHILHGQFHESQDVCRERLKSRRSFVPAARKLLDSLSEMDVRAAEWTNTKWDMEYSANALSLHAFIPKASSRPLGMGLPRAAWVKLNRLRSGVGRFCSSMYKWGLAPLANCECGASEQTADHIISQCPIHRAPRGMFGLMVLDDETRCWLKSLTVSI